MSETTRSAAHQMTITATVKIKSIHALFGLVELASGTRARNWLLCKLLQCMDSIEVAKQSKTIQEQAKHVREIIQKGRTHPRWANFFGKMYPEISNELEDCVLCKESFLLRIHPSMICYTCWLEFMIAIQKTINDTRAGMDVREAQRLFEERLERLAPAAE